MHITQQWSVSRGRSEPVYPTPSPQHRSVIQPQGCAKAVLYVSKVTQNPGLSASGEPCFAGILLKLIYTLIHALVTYWTWRSLNWCARMKQMPNQAVCLYTFLTSDTYTLYLTYAHTLTENPRLHKMTHSTIRLVRGTCCDKQFVACLTCVTTQPQHPHMPLQTHIHAHTDSCSHEYTNTNIWSPLD